MLEFRNTKEGASYAYLVHERYFIHMPLYLTEKYSALAYTSRTYSEALVMIPAVSYILYATSSHEKTVSIITFAQFGERGLLEN